MKSVKLKKISSHFEVARYFWRPCGRCGSLTFFRFLVGACAVRRPKMRAIFSPFVAKLRNAPFRLIKLINDSSCRNRVC